MLQDCSQFQSQSVHIHGCVFHDIKWHNSWSNMEDPVVSLERKFHGHPLAGLLWERQFQEVLLELGWDKYRIGNVCLFKENKDYSIRNCG